MLFFIGVANAASDDGPESFLLSLLRAHQLLQLPQETNSNQQAQ